MSSIDAAQCPSTMTPEPILFESDTELLQRFAAQQTGWAFEELMRRHGPMVMGVCRRVLSECHDAEDAYQTTFLLLVQKSAAIRRPERLANWLFGVAYRVAARIRKKAGQQESRWVQPVEGCTEDSTVEVARRELRSVLDEELHRLPAAYRLPLILCYLEGKTHIQAARELGWPSGSMSSRLARARAKLRRRLARRGLAFTSALLGMLLREQAYGGVLSPELVQRTARAALVCAGGEPSLGDGMSDRVAELLEEMKEAVFAAKARQLGVLVLLLLLLGSAGNAVRILHGERTVRAELRRDATPPPLTWVAASGQSGIVSRAALPATGMLTDVRESTAAAADNQATPPKASVSACH